MLAFGRALLSNPHLFLFDEPSLGIEPIIVHEISERIRRLADEGYTIVLVEQDIQRSLRAADHAYILLKGKVVLEGQPSSLTEAQVKEAYFGI
jgi:branched-chain amino acid transport system ATP-binding protein